MLHCVVIFSALLMIAVNVRAQCKRPLVGDNRILSNESNDQTFPDGSTVRFHCAPGYTTISGSKKITCNGTQWTDLELQCKKKSCGNPGEIVNGNYLMPDGILFGAIVTAVCFEGYQLAARFKTRKCREQGWDGGKLECEVVKCEAPPHIKYGTFEPEEELYEYRRAVTYSCERGRDLIGPSVITCSSDGTFQPPPPQCLFRFCDTPQISNAVRIHGKLPPYNSNESVHYQCNKGYRMEGSGFLTCTENGWDPRPPLCTVITCSKPPGINKGQFKPLKEFYEYGEIVTYSCDPGFGLHGASRISCTDDGTFETSVSQCLEITCDSPSIKNVVINGSSPPYKYNDSIQIRCNKGYKIKGSDYLTCGESGWNPLLPVCIEITCDSPSIKNVVINGSLPPYKYNDSIQIRCNKGYKIKGSDYLTCGESGWNPLLPVCIDHQRWRIPLIVMPVLIILIVVGVAFLWWMKSRKCKECKAPSNPDDCSLVNMSSSAPQTEEA